MEEQGSNHSGGGGQLGRWGIHVGELRSRAPTMVGVTSVGIVWFDVGEWRSRAPTIVEVTSVGMVSFDVGEWRSKAPTMVSVREAHVEFCLMLGNGGARLQPWWGLGESLVEWEFMLGNGGAGLRPSWR